jgi:glycosyltransferase involved in cell wall biosynthesis
LPPLLVDRKHPDVRISVIIPAFNEEAGIGRLLGQLTESPDFGPALEIIVAANGCTDRTAEVARSYDVRVIDMATPSKTSALNAADEVATGDVRIYLDADVPITAGLLRQLAAAVAEPGVEAAVPRPLIDASASSWPVRAYYAVNSRLPVFRRRLFGRGVIAMSAAARARFAAFPEITADDMFLDAIVAADEKIELDVPVRVTAPRRTGELVRRIARARNGNDEFWHFVRSVPPGYGLAIDPVPGSRASSWLRDVVLREPRLLPSAVCYVAIVLLAEAKRRSPGWSVRSGWGRPAPAAESRFRYPGRDSAQEERVPDRPRAPVDVPKRM